MSRLHSRRPQKAAREPASTQMKKKPLEFSAIYAQYQSFFKQDNFPQCFCILEETVGNPVLMDDKTLYIDDLCVDENRRKQGIATALFDHAVEFAKQRRYDAVTLNVWCGNDGAMKFYESCGLVPQKVGMEKIL